MLRGTFDFDGRRLDRAIREFGPKVDSYVHAVMDYQSGKALTHMKTNAPWTDRTGNARNGLSAEVDWEPMRRHAIVLFHRVTYGIFLETRWGGRYAIILPTIQKFGPDTMRMLQGLFGKMSRGGLG